MTDTQKAMITEMRRGGSSLKEVSATLGLSLGTVKSFCSRNEVVTDNASSIQRIEAQCKNCGIQILRTPGARKKEYCSDKCRIDWWNKRRTAPGRPSVHKVACAHCGTVFHSNDANRKYCAHACYIAHRYAAYDRSIHTNNGRVFSPHP